MGKRKLTRRQRWRIDKIQQEREARAEKKQQQAEETLDHGQLGPEQHGLVTAHYGTTLDIELLEQPGEATRCHVRANLPSLVTGDRVVWCPSLNSETGVVVALQQRSSLLERPDNHGRIKPVAANINCLLIVVAPWPEPHEHLIDRYLVAAELTGIEPVILLNKTDLVNSDNEHSIKRLMSLYQQIGYTTLQASTQTSDGLNELIDWLNQRTTAFVGQSGVGKSSLVNTLLPDSKLKVTAVSDATGKGMHTTSTARLFHLPEGGMLIDSPGIREFSLWHMEPESITGGFREFRPFIGHCRFRDCKHNSEPGCAIRQALDDQLITDQRMQSYRRIIHTLNENHSAGRELREPRQE